MRLRARARLAAAIDALGLPVALIAMRSRTESRVLAVVNYHRVTPAEAAGEFDEGTADATPETLDAHLQMLRAHFAPIRLADLVQSLRGGPSLPANAVLVTFDDGYRECLDVALPLLQRHGIPGVFFIATHYVSERKVFWWDRLSWLLKNARQARFQLAYPEPVAVDLSQGMAEGARTLLRLVKSRPGLRLEQFLSEIADACGAPWNSSLEEALADRLVLTWDQVRQLRAGGMDIGSHTRTHRVLRTLAADQLDDELAGSRRELEEQLGEAVTALSYPVGYPVEGTLLREAVTRAGYEIAFSYGTGLQPLNRVDPLNVRRLSVERDWNAGRLRSVLAIPALG